MTVAIIGLGTFFLVGLFVGWFFRGLNPFWMFLGFVIGGQMVIAVLNTESHVLHLAFIVGFVSNFGNPLAWVGNVIEELKMNWLLAKTKFSSRERFDDETPQGRPTPRRGRRGSQREERQESEPQPTRRPFWRRREKPREESRGNQRGERTGEGRRASGRERNTSNEREYTQSQSEYRRIHGETEEPAPPPKQPVDTRTHEEVLGLETGYTEADLKRAYREESKRFHPDRLRNKPAHLVLMMEEEQKKINRAYEALRRRFE